MRLAERIDERLLTPPLCLSLEQQFPLRGSTVTFAKASPCICGSLLSTVTLERRGLQYVDR